MKSAYNFTVEYVDAHNVWGEMINGTWIGIVGQVSSGVIQNDNLKNRSHNKTN